MKELRTKAILAISGGADSMYLLDHYKNEKAIVVATVNYNIRHDSHEDVEIVKNFCNKYNIEHRLLDVHMPENVNMESWARDIRYKFFNDLLNEFNYQWIITAHNADDQAETVLMRIMRGTGIKGLSSIRIDSKPFYRPMLDTTKKEVYQYCKLNNIPFHEDYTNKDTTLTRNWFRHVLIPTLENREESVNQLCRIAELSQKISDKISQHSKLLFDDVIVVKYNHIYIPKTIEVDAMLFTYLQDLFADYDIKLTEQLFSNIFSQDKTLRVFKTNDMFVNKRKNKNIEIYLKHF